MGQVAEKLGMDSEFFNVDEQVEPTVMSIGLAREQQLIRWHIELIEFHLYLLLILDFELQVSADCSQDEFLLLKHAIAIYQLTFDAALQIKDCIGSEDDHAEPVAEGIDGNHN